MKELSLNTVFIRNPEIVTADMNGETVMMSVETGKYYNLGKMGSAIWTMLETPLSAGDMIDKLLNAYNVGREQCEKEVISFLSELRDNHIIKEFLS